MERSDGREKGRDVIAGIGAGVIVTGDVACTSELQVDGRVNGEIRCTTLFLSEGGIIEGSIHVERARLSGRIEGAINAGDLAIEQGAQVKGDITYSRLKVATGAVIEGSIKHRAAEETASEGANLKLVEPAPPAAPPTPAPPAAVTPVTPVTPSAPRRVYVD